MALIEYIAEGAGGATLAKGSDSRLNVSSRTDDRFYYNSRDEGQAFSMVFDDNACSSGDFNAVLFNDRSDGFDMVIRSAAVNSVANDTIFKLHEVTGSAAGGAVTSTPYRLNRSGKTGNAKVVASTVVNSDSSPISGISSSFEVDTVCVVGGGHEEFRLGDVWRLGEGQGLAIQADTTTNGTRVHGVIFCYFEKVN